MRRLIPLVNTIAIRGMPICMSVGEAVHDEHCSIIRGVV